MVSIGDIVASSELLEEFNKPNTLCTVFDLTDNVAYDIKDFPDNTKVRIKNITNVVIIGTNLYNIFIYRT